MPKRPHTQQSASSSAATATHTATTATVQNLQQHGPVVQQRMDLPLETREERLCMLATICNSLYCKQWHKNVPIFTSSLLNALMGNRHRVMALHNYYVIKEVDTTFMVSCFTCGAVGNIVISCKDIHSTYDRLRREICEDLIHPHAYPEIRELCDIYLDTHVPVQAHGREKNGMIVYTMHPLMFNRNCLDVFMRKQTIHGDSRYGEAAKRGIRFINGYLCTFCDFASDDLSKAMKHTCTMTFKELRIHDRRFRGLIFQLPRTMEKAMREVTVKMACELLKLMPSCIKQMVYRDVGCTSLVPWELVVKTSFENSRGFIYTGVSDWFVCRDCQMVVADIYHTKHMCPDQQVKELRQQTEEQSMRDNNYQINLDCEAITSSALMSADYDQQEDKVVVTLYQNWRYYLHVAPVCKPYVFIPELMKPHSRAMIERLCEVEKCIRNHNERS